MLQVILYKTVGVHVFGGLFGLVVRFYEPANLVVGKRFELVCRETLDGFLRDELHYEMRETTEWLTVGYGSEPQLQFIVPLYHVVVLQRYQDTLLELTVDFDIGNLDT